MSVSFKYFGQPVDAESMFFFIKRDHNELFNDIKKRLNPDYNSIMDKCVDTSYGMTHVYADFNQFSSLQKINLFLLNENALLWMTEYDSALTKFLINNYPKILDSLMFNITPEDRLLFIQSCARRQHFADNIRFTFQTMAMNNNVCEWEQGILEKAFWGCLHDRFDFTINRHMTHEDNYISTPLNRFKELFGYTSDDIPESVFPAMLEFINESKMWAFNIKEHFRHMIMHDEEYTDSRYTDFFTEAYAHTLKNHYEPENLKYIPDNYVSRLKNELNKLKLIHGHSLTV